MLAHGWEEVRMGDGQSYFHHKELDLTQWEPPLAAVASPATTTTDSHHQLPSGHLDLESGSTAPIALFQAAKYFEVTTADILQRLTVVLMPHRLWTGEHGVSQTLFIDKPDFYGPFWITQTLSFLLFACGHLYAWMTTGHVESHYSTLLSASIFANVWWLGAPFIIKMMGSEHTNSLKYPVMICAYGYSLIPGMLCTILSAMITYKTLQLSLALICAAYSLWFLTLSLKPDLQQRGRSQYILIGGCVFFHLVFYLAIPLSFLTLIGSHHTAPLLAASPPPPPSLVLQAEEAAQAVGPMMPMNPNAANIGGGNGSFVN